MLPNGNPASFEHRQREAWKRKNQDKEIIAQLEKDKVQFKMEIDIEQLREVEESLRENFESELKQKAVKENQWEQQRYSYNDAISRLTSEKSELKEYIQELEFQQKESKKIIEELQSRHQQELEQLKNSSAERIQDLTMQMQQLKDELAQQQERQKSSTSVNSINSNSGNYMINISFTP